MPELPEVDALATDLRGRLAGRAFARVQPVAFSALKTFDPAPDALTGLFVEGVTRHGKFIDIDLGGIHFVTHLARAGWLRWHDVMPETRPRSGGKSPLAMRVVLDDGSGFDLTEAGTQKRLAVYVVRDPAEVPGVARLGPDPLDPAFTPQVLAKLLEQAGRSQIKGVLRDQSVIAGIGNAYSDEILHTAKLSPFKMTDRLDVAEVSRLHAAIQEELTDAVNRSIGQGAATLKSEKRSGLRVHARTGLPCPVCGDTIREVSFADNSLQYCPTCQTGGKPLADRRMSKLLR